MKRRPLQTESGGNSEGEEGYCKQKVNYFPVYDACSNPGRRRKAGEMIVAVRGTENECVEGGDGGLVLKCRSAPLPESSMSLSHPEHTYITPA